MRMSMSMSICQEVQPSFHFIPPGGIDMRALRRYPQKEKVVVVMGATGAGKTRLSIDLAKHFQAEIVNSDKIQVYEGLDIVTNKVTVEERRGVPHHLLGVADPYSDFSASDFCNMALSVTNGIVARRNLPIIAGGSNSFIEALIDGKDKEFRSRYECCFLWVDVSMPVLHSHVSDRVDRMVEAGMISEVRNIFDPRNSDYSRGVRKAIGVPEFDRYFRCTDGELRLRLLEEAISEIKKNNCKLACKQLEKIHRLRNVKGWNLYRLDATEVFRKKGKKETEAEAEEAWEKQVVGPSFMTVKKFLLQQQQRKTTSSYSDAPTNSTTTGGTIRKTSGGSKRVVMVTAATAMAAATH